jgi:mono/diheme cytochrome c family protein
LFSSGKELFAWAQEGIDQEKLNQGTQLYADNCAVCHGSEGQGRIVATLAKDWLYSP